jgi:hypothetical protein
MQNGCFLHALVKFLIYFQPNVLSYVQYFV